MNRRRFLLAGAMLAGISPAAVQQPPAHARIGWLAHGDTMPRHFFDEALAQLGWVEGKNLTIERRFAGSSGAELASAAAELVAWHPEAVTATKTVPVVMVANDYDPVARGYVASLARPGGNVTGVFLQQIELTPKQLEFLTEAVPGMARVVVLWDRFSADQFEAAREAARSVKIPLDGIECTDAPYDYERALAGVEGGHRDALLLLTSPVFFVDRQRLAAVALDHRLPSMFAFRQWVDEGGLMSYGASLADTGRLAADYVDRIAKGAKPADLPVQQPTRFELVINLKTAKALGLTVPPSILARADEVIE